MQSPYYPFHFLHVGEVDETSFEGSGNVDFARGPPQQYTSTYASQESVRNAGSQYETWHDTQQRRAVQYPNQVEVHNVHDYGSCMPRAFFDDPWNPLLHQIEPALLGTQRSPTQRSWELVTTDTPQRYERDHVHGTPHTRNAQTTVPIPQPTQVPFNAANLSAQQESTTPDMLTQTPQRGAKVPIERERRSSSSETSSSPSSGKSNIPCPKPGCDSHFTRCGSLDRHLRNKHRPNPPKYACPIDSFYDTRKDKVRAHCRDEHRQVKGKEQFATIINDDWSAVGLVKPPPKKTRSQRSAS